MINYKRLKTTLFFIFIGFLFSVKAHAVELMPLPQSYVNEIDQHQYDAASWMLVENLTGWILVEHNSKERIEPASLSKIMTAYIVFDALETGRIKLQDLATVSERAWRRGGSRMFLELNSKVSIEKLIKGLLIQSGNDAAVVLAEHIAGNVESFASLMNKKANDLGLTNTNFTNASGLPDPNHYTSAQDLLKLTLSMIDHFPEFYNLYQIKEYTYNDITQQNRNRLLWINNHVDGVKTGHTKNAGYCLIGSAFKDNMRLTAIVTGAKSIKARNEIVNSLLEYGYNYFKLVTVYAHGDEVSQLPVYKGEFASSPVTVKNQLDVIVPRNKEGSITAQITTPKYVVAPYSKEVEVGQVTISLADQILKQSTLVLSSDIKSGRIWTQITDQVKLWIND